MPKGKSKGKSTRKSKTCTPLAPTPVSESKVQQCLTFEEDEITRCTRLPTHGSPPERCEVHHGQYCKMIQKYKDASKIVDEIRNGSSIPTKAEISGYADFHAALQKARWMRQYVDAIRVEKTGREIHYRRFFLKVNGGHKMRLELLAKQMVAAVEVLDSIQAQAFELHIAKHPISTWGKEPQPNNTSGGLDAAGQKMLTEKEDVTIAAPTGQDSTPQPVSSETFGSQEDDLIDMKIRANKTILLQALEPFIKCDEIVEVMGIKDLQNPGVKRITTIMHNIMIQYARRILFHDPVLSLKAIGKVSFKDLILDDNFSFEDMVKFLVALQNRMGFGLLCWKDSTLEALAMLPSGSGEPNNAASVGNPEDRLPMVGGFILNETQKQTMSNEGWWHFIKSMAPPANVENRFMRACNNFDDLHAFLSFSAFGLVDPPFFCTDADAQGEDSQASRKHLSLSGVVVVDMVSSHIPAWGPIPAERPAKKRGCITWVEVESRSYMFGAIRNEPDEFTEAFLNELRARPDLFLVLTRSDTDPGRKVETFGGSTNGQLVQMHVRSFEAPPMPFHNRPRGPGNWIYRRTAVDILYARKPIEGYLIAAERSGNGIFFRFPVKHFVILDATPGRHVRHLSRHVAWAALCAQRLVKGDYNQRAYWKASDILFQKHASERMAWMPESYGEWKVTNLMAGWTAYRRGQRVDMIHLDRMGGKVNRSWLRYPVLPVLCMIALLYYWPRCKHDCFRVPVPVYLYTFGLQTP